MATIDSDASKSFYRTVIKTEQSKGKTWLTAASQYFGESTRVLSGRVFKIGIKNETTF